SFNLPTSIDPLLTSSIFTRMFQNNLICQTISLLCHSVIGSAYSIPRFFPCYYSPFHLLQDSFCHISVYVHLNPPAFRQRGKSDCYRFRNDKPQESIVLPD